MGWERGCGRLKTRHQNLLGKRMAGIEAEVDIFVRSEVEVEIRERSTHPTEIWWEKNSQQIKQNQLS